MHRCGSGGGERESKVLGVEGVGGSRVCVWVLIIALGFLKNY